MAKLALLLLPLAVVAQIENPCQGMTVADCRIGEDNIVEQLPFDAVDCERSCEMSDNCYFWRFYQDNSMPLEPPQCLHLGTNYHKDCASFAGPIEGDIESCLNTDQNTCSAYISEECQYDGERLGHLELLPGEISSIEECQAWGNMVHKYGAAFFFYDGVTEECQMFASMQSSCSAIGGPETAPPLEQCTATTRPPTTTTTTSTTTTTTPCTCDQGWDVFGDHCYFYGTETKSWWDAEEHCKEEGGHLATVSTPAVEDYVLDELKRRGLDYAWFGGNDIEEEGVWKWTDHSPWEFTSWGAGEPNNAGRIEDCLEHHMELIWNDWPCTESIPFVCSKNIC